MEWNWVGDQGIRLVLSSQINEEDQQVIQRIFLDFQDYPDEHIQELVVGYSQIVFVWSTLTRHFSCKKMEELVERIKVRVQFCVRMETNNGAQSTQKSVISIPTRYNGPDLKFVADQTGLSVNELIEYHSAPLYRVFFIGFLPGFAYLGGLDSRLHCPRKSVPRTVVPAGSVGIGGAQTGIYPMESPGGWQLIGQSDLPLFRPYETSMTLLSMGDYVQFIPQ